MITAASVVSTPVLPLPSFVDPGHPVCFEHISWATYETLREEAPHAWRMTYNQGTLEILSPSKKHETTADLIADLFKVFCESRSIDFVSLRSTTQKIAEKYGGEPDTSFGFASTDQTVPDLVIEVEVTSRLTQAKRQLYHELGVRELWCYRSNGKLEVLVRGDDGRATATTSTLHPDLLIERIAHYAGQSGWSNRIVKAFRDELCRNDERE